MVDEPALAASWEGRKVRDAARCDVEEGKKELLMGKTRKKLRGWNDGGGSTEEMVVMFVSNGAPLDIEPPRTKTPWPERFRKILRDSVHPSPSLGSRS